MFIGLYVNYQLFLSDLKWIIPPQICEKFSNIKFNENPSSGSRAAPSGQTWRSQLLAFRNSANAPKLKSKIQPQASFNISHMELIL
jgi:hypothetical protein